MMARPGVPTLTFLLVVATLAAGPTVVWYKDYGFNEGGKVYDAAPLDGGVVVIGYAYPTASCFYAARISPNGEVVWERAWKYGDPAQLTAVCTLNGMIVAVGYSGPWNGPLRPYVCVLNGSGLLVRDTYLDSLTNFRPAGIDALEDHIVVCGEADGVPVIVVMNTNLRVLWSERLPHRGSLEAVVAEEDGIYIAGSVSGTGYTYGGSPYVAKLNWEGVLVWENKLPYDRGMLHGMDVEGNLLVVAGEVSYNPYLAVISRNNGSVLAETRYVPRAFQKWARVRGAGLLRPRRP